MNKDRGNIKWTAMMLPEHVTRLRQLSAELEKEVSCYSSDTTAKQLALREGYLTQQPLIIQLHTGEWIVGVVVDVSKDSFHIQATTLQHYAIDEIQSILEAGQSNE